MMRWTVHFADGTEQLLAPDDATEEAVRETCAQMYPQRGVLGCYPDESQPRFLPMSGPRARVRVMEGASVRRRIWGPTWFVNRNALDRIVEVRFSTSVSPTRGRVFHCDETDFNCDRFYDGDDWVECDPGEIARELERTTR